MKEIVDFLFEVGMLKKTPRTGYRFLGTGSESVAEHILRVTYIGYVLSQLEKDVDEKKVIKLCLLHDLPEARIGDQNYVYKKYVTVDEEKAVKDLTANLPFGDDIKELIDEFNKKETKEAMLANDADQLEIILQVKQEMDLGNKYGKEWLHYIKKRLITPVAKKMADIIMTRDFSDWWFKDKSDWWVNAQK
ncbi:MAG: phosphohydrolase [Thermoplasmata archaeon]|nr:MAG: phosphohydrolase [Deltaproteobacteria bacterium]RLF31696.1 MAG: phosphohydrolase [Thermoplasmata archaeon]